VTGLQRDTFILITRVIEMKVSRCNSVARIGRNFFFACAEVYRI